MKPKPSELDAALFREATRGVTPLKPMARVPTARPKSRPKARFARAARLRVGEDDPVGEPVLAQGDPSGFARPGVRPTVLRQLRRGEYRIEAALDLHGLTATQARVQLHEFLTHVLMQRIRCVRIVHGKGLRSGHTGAVLRPMVNRVLRRTALVLAFTSALPVDGGTGAVYVLLDATRHASSASTARE